MKSEEIIEAIRKFNEDERLDILSHFCCYCGEEQDPDHQCQCWNDE